MGPISVLLMAALTFSLVGCFLVLRNMAMLADALSHTILLGIVLMFLAVYDLDSPLLQVGAALFGMVTVNLIEFLVKRFGLKADAATGLVFPLFFSLAVILISIFLRNVHLCVDTVIMGEVLFTPLNTITLFGYAFPLAFVQLFVVFVAAGIFILLNFQQLKISTFDPQFAAASGITVVILHHFFMFLVSITMVVSFNAVGSILVISFLVAAPLSAFLLTKDLKKMLLAALLIGCLNAVVGGYLAEVLNVSMSGMCAVVAFVVFLLIWLGNPRGLLGKLWSVRRQKQRCSERLLLEELAKGQLTMAEIMAAFDWSEKQTIRFLRRMSKQTEVRWSQDLVWVADGSQK